MITYQSESYFTARDDGLIQMHYDEIALHKEAIPLAPDWHRYDLMDAAQDLACITARDDGKMIGYSVFFLQNHIHYMTTRMASNDVLYLHPDYRKGRIGIKLIQHSEKHLQWLGVKKIVWHIKTANDFSPILKRMGYGNEEVVMGKILGDSHGN